MYKACSRSQQEVLPVEGENTRERRRTGARPSGQGGGERDGDLENPKPFKGHSYTKKGT